MFVRWMLLAAALLAAFAPALGRRRDPDRGAEVWRAVPHGDRRPAAARADQHGAGREPGRFAAGADLCPGPRRRRAPGIDWTGQPLPASRLYRVEPWGPGPVVAGQSTVYQVITYGDQICAEMLVKRLDEAVRGARGPGARPAGGDERHAARPGLRAHPVLGLRRAGLADHGRQDRSPDLRDQDRT